MSKQKIAVFDADGVLVDFIRSFKEQASQLLNRKVANEHNTWCTKTRFKLTDSENKYIWSNLDWSKFHIYENVTKSINIFKREGYLIVILTAAPENIKEQRIQCFKKNNLFYDHLFFVENGTSKFPKLCKLKPDFFIDDHFQHINEAIEANVPDIFFCDNGYDFEKDAVKGKHQIVSSLYEATLKFHKKTTKNSILIRGGLYELRFFKRYLRKRSLYRRFQREG